MEHQWHNDRDVVSGQWVIDQSRCTQCGRCVRACPEAVIALERGYLLLVHPEACTYCGLCEELCPVGAIALAYEIVWSDTWMEADLLSAADIDRRH